MRAHIFSRIRSILRASLPFVAWLAFPTFAEPSQLAGVKQVATGSYSACSLHSDGTVSCWGANDLGQAGTTLNTVVWPTKVQGIDDAVQISSGKQHYCARLATGRVKCWGSNLAGQLGDGSLDESAARAGRSTPVEVVGLTDATLVTAGRGHTCALRRTGTVVCWGADYAGLLGNGQDPYVDRAIPVAVAGLTDVVALDADVYWTCAVRRGGEVWCWGTVAYARAEPGSVTTRSAMRTVTIPGAVAISVGSEKACAVDGAGQVWCWGSGGAIPGGSSVPNGIPPTRVGLPDAAIAIAVGHNSTCVRTSLGDVYCWGSELQGERGVDDETRPWRQATRVRLGESATSISKTFDADLSGSNHCVSLASQRVACWGNNGAGAGGQGDATAYAFAGYTDLPYPHYVLQTGTRPEVGISIQRSGTDQAQMLTLESLVRGRSPRGTVTFSIGGQTLCSNVAIGLQDIIVNQIRYPSSSIARCEVAAPKLPPGDHKIEFTYSGDTNHIPYKNPYAMYSVAVPTSQIREAIEFRNLSFDYYFVTADPTEISLLDPLSTWQRTGNKFKVFASQVANSVPVARFYFDQVARNRQRGSHFYTVSAMELAALLAINPSNSSVAGLPQYEGPKGYAMPPIGSGWCGTASATKQIYRVFRGNSRFPDDPNHRFGEYRQFDAAQAAGWDWEGVAFCSPE